MQRTSMLAVLVAAVALAGCGGSSVVAGRTGTGATTPDPAPSQAAAPATPSASGGETNILEPGGSQSSGQAGIGLAGADPSRGLTDSGASGADPAGLAGGTGIEAASPGLVALQILGVPVLALPPDVLAAGSTPAGNAGAGTNTGAGTGTGTGNQSGTNPGSGSDPATGTGTNTGAGGTPTGGGNPSGGGEPSGGNTSGGNTSGGNTSGGGTPPPPIPISTGFCGPARDLDAALDAVANAGGPGELESAVGWARSSFSTAQATAPPGLQHDVDVLAAGFGQLFDGMEAAGYDRTKVSPGAFSGLATEEAFTAQDRFNQYLADVC
ncbi:MAG TPA: hypothetical protein VF244_04195 [Acidimicrobiales bacterium]